MNLRAHETHGTADQRSPKSGKTKMRRGSHGGPLGFRQMLDLARKQHGGRGASQDGATQQAAQTVRAHHGTRAEEATQQCEPKPESTQSLLGLGEPTPGSMTVRAVDAEVRGALAGSISETQSAIALGEGSTLTTDAFLPQLQQTDQVQQLMTPQLALSTIADQASMLNRQEDLSEFVLRLEPEHLGPLIIRMRTKDGRLTAELITSNDAATAQLASGSAALRDRLARLGFGSAKVDVRRRQQDDQELIERVFGRDA